MATQLQTTTQKQIKKAAAPKVAAVKAEVKKVAAKPVQKAATASKAHSFKIAAGVIAKIEHKELSKAIKYHVGQGNIEKTASGYKLTDKGALNFGKRTAAEPQLFQEIAAFVHGKGPAPKVWANQKPMVKVSEVHTFPSIIHWNYFVTKNMRLAFASLWAK